jgi:hypothetical protein
MKVRNMQSPHGNKIANQFIIESEQATVFQSYDSIIVKKMHNGSSSITYLDEMYWDYSKTTGKYRNIFLGETKAETQKKIDSGEYILTNLN